MKKIPSFVTLCIISLICVVILFDLFGEITFTAAISKFGFSGLISGFLIFTVLGAVFLLFVGKIINTTPLVVKIVLSCLIVIPIVSTLVLKRTDAITNNVFSFDSQSGFIAHMAVPFGLALLIVWSIGYILSRLARR